MNRGFIFCEDVDREVGVRRPATVVLAWDRVSFLIITIRPKLINNWHSSLETGKSVLFILESRPIEQLDNREDFIILLRNGIIQISIFDISQRFSIKYRKPMFTFFAVKHSWICLK